MPRDLVKEFFARDLSDAELDALQKRLSSETEALRFSTEAERFHRGLGAAAVAALALKLAQAGKSASGAGWGSLFGTAAKAVAVKAVVVAASAGLVTAGGVAIYHAYHSAPVLEAQPARPMPVIPVPQPVQAARPEQHGKQVALKLDLQVPAEVTALVVDEHGTIIRELGTQTMGSGTNRLVWDGYDGQGQVPGPGRYQVIVRWNGKEAGKWVELRSAH